MVHILCIWLVILAFAGGGLANGLGPPALRASFVRWGYPAWWRHVTSALELAVAVLVAVPAGRTAGLLLGAAVMAAAALTVLLRRDFSHLPPVAVFAVLLMAAAVTS